MISWTVEPDITWTYRYIPCVHNLKRNILWQTQLSLDPVSRPSVGRIMASLGLFARLWSKSSIRSRQTTWKARNDIHPAKHHASLSLTTPACGSEAPWKQVHRIFRKRRLELQKHQNPFLRKTNMCLLIKTLTGIVGNQTYERVLQAGENTTHDLLKPSCYARVRIC